jgi:hypothetical protein
VSKFREAVNAAQTAVDDAGVGNFKNKQLHGFVPTEELPKSKLAWKMLSSASSRLRRAVKSSVSTNQFFVMFEVDEGVVSPSAILRDGDRTKNMLITKKLDPNYDMRQESNNKRPLSDEDDEEAAAGLLQDGDQVLYVTPNELRCSL